MTIKELRFITGLTQKDFSEKYNIPKRSIENWEYNTRECAVYVVELLERAVSVDYENRYKALKLLRENTKRYYDEFDCYIDSDCLSEMENSREGKHSYFWFTNDDIDNIAVNLDTLEVIEDENRLDDLFC